jgi:hypothetical protein
VDAPAGVPKHEKDPLSATSWVKRRWRELRRLDGFPSTLSIASAPFRCGVLAAWEDSNVRAAVERLRAAAVRIHRRSETPIAGLTDGPGGQVADWLRRDGGPPIYPDWWEAERLARDTGRPVGDIRTVVMERRGVAAPTDYLAVLVQDLDGLGAFLGGAGRDAVGRTLAEVTV